MCPYYIFVAVLKPQAQIQKKILPMTSAASIFPWEGLEHSEPTRCFHKCHKLQLPCIYPWSMSLVDVLPSFPMHLCPSVIRQDNPKIPWNPPQIFITCAMGNSPGNLAFPVSYNSLGSVLNYMKCPFEGWVKHNEILTALEPEVKGKNLL